jgi:protein SCO1/2
MTEAAGRLAAMLPEQSPVYAGLGANEVERRRARILSAFETAGLAPEAVPFVLEELETGRNPWTVAAAARALRGADEIPGEAPALLVAAIGRLRGADEVVSFEGAAQGGAAVTACAELARTLAFLGPRAAWALPELTRLIDEDGEGFSPAVRAGLADAAEALARAGAPADACCCAEHEAGPAAPRGAAVAPAALEDLALEDQDGARLRFGEAFRGRPAALAFFYTRCMTPEKCSLTVTRLARLADRLAAEGLDATVAGVSYDPAFDRPARLRTYGADRGMRFSPRCRLLRTVGPFEPLRDAFDLGVGFGPVTVNRHRLDLVVLDAGLGVAERFERRLWHEDAVLDALRALLADG